MTRNLAVPKLRLKFIHNSLVSDSANNDRDDDDDDDDETNHHRNRDENMTFLVK